MTFLTSRWRLGRRVPEHVYVQVADEPADEDTPLATLPREIAGHVVAIHNNWLEAQSAPSKCENCGCPEEPGKPAETLGRCWIGKPEDVIRQSRDAAEPKP